jgi:hypothetical protein
VWGALVKLGATKLQSGHDIKGLQVLADQDLTVLAQWLEDELYRSKGSELPWIWTVLPCSSVMANDGKGQEIEMEVER